MAAEPRARILESARALYLEGGAEAVTMRSVAKKVGVTATALYRHFDNKDDLLGELIRQGFETFGTYLYRALSGRTPAERLRRSAEAYCDFALEQREMYRTLFMSQVTGDRKELVKRNDPDCDPRSTYRFLIDRLRECIESGDVRDEDPELLAVSVWAHVHGLVSLQICGSMGVPDDKFRQAYRRSIDLLMSGLARKAKPTP
ncbi:MAG TPA: TetR/AcrR family transcriptional regulator [Myxococcales bacterium]|nr:TetR/AcrR family transcriptional regulator [Myxococcales bacterium]